MRTGPSIYADPDFAKLPVATLISKPYAGRGGP